jgi:hypothetical protein
VTGRPKSQLVIASHGGDPFVLDLKASDGLFTLYLIMAMPVLSPMGLVASFFLPRSQKNDWTPARRFMLSLLYVATCFIALKIL